MGLQTCSFCAFVSYIRSVRMTCCYDGQVMVDEMFVADVCARAISICLLTNCWVKWKFYTIKFEFVERRERNGRFCVACCYDRSSEMHAQIACTRRHVLNQFHTPSTNTRTTRKTLSRSEMNDFFRLFLWFCRDLATIFYFFIDRRQNNSQEKKHKQSHIAQIKTSALAYTKLIYLHFFNAYRIRRIRRETNYKTLE